MGISVFPAASAASKTMYRTTLLSGTTYTVPAGVTYLNVTTVGGGGGGSSTVWSTGNAAIGSRGRGGQIVHSTLSSTPGGTISYAIGAGGSAPGTSGNSGSSGGDTTFTGATTASGGKGGNYETTSNSATVGLVSDNGGYPFHGQGGGAAGTAGAAGCIVIEYWV